MSDHVIEIHTIDRLAIIETQIEQNTADQITLYREVHEEELWQGRYHSYEDWLERRWGIDLAYLHDMNAVRLPSRLHQREIWELPAPTINNCTIDVQALLEAAKKNGGRNEEIVLGEIACERSEILSRQLDEIDARESVEEDMSQFNRGLARARAAARVAYHFGMEPAEAHTLLQPFVDRLCEVAEKRVPISRDEAIAKMLPGKKGKVEVG